MENFEKSMAEILEVDNVNSNDHLDGFDVWDSLTILTIIAFCEKEYKIIISAEEIDNSETIEGLKNLIQNKISNSK